jgi:hypothetical protein
MLPPDLIRIDSRSISDDTSEIRLFGIVKNEFLRLPYFLQYYRRAGIGQFFFVDNDSSDGTREFLVDQHDCTVFHTKGSYALSRAGLKWLNPLIDRYGENRWIVLADADELLVFPGTESKSLPSLCRWLDQKGHQGLFALLLDMYSDRPLQEVGYTRGDDFLTACHFFDRDYHFVRRLGIPLLEAPCPDVEPIGGPRLRLCFPNQNSVRLWPRLRVKLARRLSRLSAGLAPVNWAAGESVASQAFKIPLVKWRRGYAFVTSHRLNRIRLAPLTGALLHFKYFQDFAERVKYALDSNMHYDGSAEYGRYAELLRRDPELSLTYAGSVSYGGSEDLVRLHLIKTDPDWDRICRV